MNDDLSRVDAQQRADDMHVLIANTGVEYMQVPDRRAGSRSMGGAGVSASTARRPHSRLAVQGQPWIAPTKPEPCSSPTYIHRTDASPNPQYPWNDARIVGAIH